MNFPAPHAGLALAAISDYVSDWALDPAQALDEAERWARRAIELNDQEPVSHMALGSVFLAARSRGRALGFRHMIVLDPNFAQGHAATGLALMYAGRAAEALEPIARQCAWTRTIRPLCCTSWRGRPHLGEYETAAQLLVRRTSALLAPTPAACCWHLVTAISGAGKTRGPHGQSYFR